MGKSGRPRGIIEDKDRKITEVPDLTIKPNKYKMDLIPPRLVISRYFTQRNRSRLMKLTTKLVVATSQIWRSS